ncbi:MAG: ABC transporter ATP-binding protein [Ignavibacteriales bacterium]
MQKIIEIKNIRTYIESTRVFDGLSLEITQGCNTAILGPNGAGKTTLLRLLTREIYPVHLEDSYIRLFGEERWNVWELRSRMGIVSHNLQQNYPVDVPGINVILSGIYSSSDIWAHQKVSPEEYDKAGSIMNLLGIYGLKDREFAGMSTGQQRRLLLGRALINDPEVLILDEPTSGLDLKACFQYIDIIRELMNNGKTIILVTHHIHEIPPEISRVVLLKDGHIIADGLKSEILNNRNLSSVYDFPVDLISSGGFYQVIPGHSIKSA